MSAKKSKKNSLSPIVILTVLFVVIGIITSSATTIVLFTKMVGVSSIQSDTPGEPVEAPVNNGDSPSSPNTSATVADTQSNPQSASTSDSNSSSSSTANSDKSDSSKQDGNTPAAKLSTTEDIVKYFNECANKVKTDASTVTKNFENRELGEVEVPAGLESIAESLLPTLISDDTDPITYTGNAEIKDNFIVPGQDYVSCLTANDVVNATAKDNGDTYEIYFLLKDEENPVSGKGVGSCCDVIEAKDVAERAPDFVKDVKTNYHGCKITATIDKNTGTMIHAVYSTPVTLSVVVDLLGTHNISAEFTYVKDFTIEY